jgi:DNA segregation ATPase FtsK/SpoIIIE, S-DNA-T family
VPLRIVHGAVVSLFRRELRPEGGMPTLRFRAPAVRIPLRLLVYGWLTMLAFRLLRWLAVHPRCSIVLAVAVWLVAADWVVPAAIVGCVAAGALCLWWAMWPGSFHRWMLRPLQLELREWFVYRRNWQPAMLTCGLTLREHWGGDLPTLRRVRNEMGRDLLRVRMLDGQTPAQWEAARAALAQTFGVRHVRVRRVADRPRELDLLMIRRGTPIGAPIRHVTEELPVQESVEVPAPRGAFPRQPRGGV